MANELCEIWGSHHYGDVNDTSSIVHLDAPLGNVKNLFNYTATIEKA